MIMKLNYLTTQYAILNTQKVVVCYLLSEEGGRRCCYDNEAKLSHYSIRNTQYSKSGYQLSVIRKRQ